jgi:hypothetical protein
VPRGDSTVVLPSGCPKRSDGTLHTHCDWGRVQRRHEMPACRDRCAFYLLAGASLLHQELNCTLPTTCLHQSSSGGCSWTPSEIRHLVMDAGIIKPGCQPKLPIRFSPRGCSDVQSTTQQLSLHQCIPFCPQLHLHASVKAAHQLHNKTQPITRFRQQLRPAQHCHPPQLSSSLFIPGSAEERYRSSGSRRVPSTPCSRLQLPDGGRGVAVLSLRLVAATGLSCRSRSLALLRAVLQRGDQQASAAAGQRFAQAAARELLLAQTGSAERVVVGAEELRAVGHEEGSEMRPDREPAVNGRTRRVNVVHNDRQLRLVHLRVAHAPLAVGH